MNRTYLVPFDGSDFAKEAFKFALNNGGADDLYILLNIQTKKDHLLLEEIPEEKLHRHFIEEANRILSLADDIAESTDRKVIKEIKIGYPSIEISKLAKETNAYSIIMGSRGLSPSIGGVLGSVTHGVIHLAPCPVTIVPSN